VASNPGLQSGFVPFTIPIWGFVEARHIHVDNHMNYIFHVDNGFIVGAASYPVRDAFQETQRGTILHMHGAVRWFRKGGYEPYFGSLIASFWQDFKTSFLQIFLIVGLIFLAVLNVFVFFYWLYLKPRVISKISSAQKKAPNSQAIVQPQAPPAQEPAKQVPESTPPT